MTGSFRPKPPTVATGNPKYSTIVVDPTLVAVEPKNDSIDGWRWMSPHLIDCGEMMAALAEETDDGIFVRTQTDPPFMMNIHNPKQDEVSRVIQDEGCWECGHLRDMLGALSAYEDSYFLDIVSFACGFEVWLREICIHLWLYRG